MITRKTALKRIFGLLIGGFFLFSFAKKVLADFAFDWAGEEMFIFRDDASSSWGVPGDTRFGDNILRVVGPLVDKKSDLGEAAKKFNKGFFGGIVDVNESGVRTKTNTTSSLASPPTDAELDSEFGNPASLGAGWMGFIEDTTDNQYWFCVTDGTAWYFEEVTKAT